VPSPADPAVEVTGVRKRYGAVTALDGVDLRVAPGTVHGLLGPNGAGKTTLLRMLFGLVRIDAGTVSVLGERVAPHRAPAGVAGFVESPRFYPYLSAQANLDLLASLDGMHATVETVDELLERVGLGGRGADRVSGFSFGMRQRLGIAAALLREPRLLILDEPANGLDPAGMRDMRALVRELADDGRTVLISSHLMAEVEQVCEDVTILRTGSVVYHGTLDALRDSAPAPAHHLRTSDDPAARVAAADRPGVDVAPHPDGGLAVRAETAELDAYLLELAKSGVAVRALELTTTSLEQLFLDVTGEDA
jgi:ABC-2 type transport system ATP-binding protein